MLTETSALLASRVSKHTEIEFLDWVAAGAITVEALDAAQRAVAFDGRAVWRIAEKKP